MMLRTEFKLDLLIIDEAQKVGDGARGVLLHKRLNWPLQDGRAARLYSLVPCLAIQKCYFATQEKLASE